MRDNNENLELESSRTELIEVATPYFLESGKEWFNQALQTLAGSDQVLEDLGLYSAMARRKLGEERLQQAASTDDLNATVDISRWNSAEAARMVLLMSAIDASPEPTESVIGGYYQMGDESEHIALIRGLGFFGRADFLTVIALDAGRSNNLEVLAALTLDNPYPAAFFSDDQFNQMVLKALFLGLAIERVWGLQQRANPDLARMGENYVIEREQAGRPVPADVWLAIGPCASETGRRQMVDYLGHEEVGHRYYCSLALVNRLAQDPSLLPILQQRLDSEQETLILELLQDALKA
jgi:hypothetical protein